MKSQTVEEIARHYPIEHIDNDCCVAELVKDPKLRASAAARAAADKEWDNLVARECWILSEVVPWKDVYGPATKAGKTVHLGDLCELVYLKGSELPEGHESRKLKGRVVKLQQRVMQMAWIRAGCHFTCIADLILLPVIPFQTRIGTLLL